MAEEVTPSGDEPSMELVAVTDVDTFASFLAGMVEAPEPTVEDRATLRFSIIREILHAENEEEMWRELPTWSSKDVVDRVYRVLDARAIRSSIENDEGIHGSFLSCRAIDLETGELGILNTSALRLCGRIGWYYLHDDLPKVIRVVSLGTSSRGYPILDGRRVEGMDDFDPNPANPLLEDDDEVVEDAEVVDENAVH